MHKKYFILSPIIAFIIYVTLTSSSGGITGVSSSGCSCHGAQSANTVVTISGLPATGYINSAVYSITISVTNTTIVGSAPNGLRDGFDLTATAGTFTAIAGTSSASPFTEIRHNTPKVPISGTASWTFNWTAPATGSATVNFAVAGNATNGNGGTTGDQWNKTTASLVKGGPLAVTASAPAITCNGNLVTITALGSGGTAPLQYQLNAGVFQSANTFTSNPAGNYTITVKDATTATASSVISLSQPTAIVPAASNSTIACNGGTSTITASATGGTGAYTYQRNTGSFQTSATFLNNLAGTYTITVRDANLCTKTILLPITQPAAVNFTTPTISNPNCNGGTGSVVASVSGGTGTITYSINPLGPQSNTSGLFSGLNAQNYTITATDANLCTKTTLVTITQPALITLSTPTVVNPLCWNLATGNISTAASGGTGAKTYTINPLGPQTNSTGNFTGLTAQVYTITATDNVGCTNTKVATVSEPTPISFGTPTLSPPPCIGGTSTISILANGGTGALNYTINPLGPQSNTTGNFTGLTAQTYTITASDNNGCVQFTTVTTTEINCNSILNLKLFLQGYYVGGNQMTPVLQNQGVPGALPNEVDDVTVTLYNATFNVVTSAVAKLKTDGTIQCVFPALNGNYWIAINHRNGLQTWSNTMVSISNIPATYDFTNLASKAFGDNQVEMETGVFAFYNSDINQDFAVDAFDFLIMDPDIINGAAGYLATDINGDGAVDSFDYLLLDPNINLGVSTIAP